MPTAAPTPARFPGPGIKPSLASSSGDRPALRPSTSARPRLPSCPPLAVGAAGEKHNHGDSSWCLGVCVNTREGGVYQSIALRCPGWAPGGPRAGAGCARGRKCEASRGAAAGRSQLPSIWASPSHPEQKPRPTLVAPFFSRVWCALVLAALALLPPGDYSPQGHRWVVTSWGELSVLRNTGHLFHMGHH